MRQNKGGTSSNHRNSTDKAKGKSLATKSGSSFVKVEIGVGHRVRFVRGDMTQDEFAEMMDIHRNTVTTWESGGQIPSGTHLIRLFELFKININWLLLGLGGPYLTEAEQKRSTIITKRKSSTRMRRLGRDKETGHFVSVKEAKKNKETAVVEVMPLFKKGAN